MHTSNRQIYPFEKDEEGLKKNDYNEEKKWLRREIS